MNVVVLELEVKIGVIPVLEDQITWEGLIHIKNKDFIDEFIW